LSKPNDNPPRSKKRQRMTPKVNLNTTREGEQRTAAQRRAAYRNPQSKRPR